ncbi:flagellar basal body-associated protein FliL [Gallaecimonas xiamenensis]|uniref:Flagellar protein FliL n=1 Tax=Gallaecimonas xiamenensis 3-C-1 TaxID=745411 RepID=K2JSK3_9GAMM|nr:flagellar basal body-associated protein FliL [Gallaecimonas xiamenensis]EKE77482.1 flagellar basal body-associated protein FliL-like protein [Gallaecimonas xiamenensis 3-C-1]
MRYLLPLLLMLSTLAPIAALADNPAPAADYGYYELEPDIITNYVGQGNRLGYVKLSVQLMVKDKSKLAKVEHHAPLLRDALIEILGNQNSDDIKSLQGREQIRKACLKTAQDLMQAETGEPVVADLLFTKYLYY